MNALKTLVGDKEDADSLEIISNLEDTYDNSTTELQGRYDKLTEDHNKVLKAYKERFFSGEPKKDPPADDKPKSELTLTKLLKGDK